MTEKDDAVRLAHEIGGCLAAWWAHQPCGGCGGVDAKAEIYCGSSRRFCPACMLQVWEDDFPPLGATPP